MSRSDFDLAIVGGGLGGLALAALAQRAGWNVVLLEAHTHLGGCAGWYRRGAYTFDVGATALMGLKPDEPLGQLLRLLELNFTAVPTRSYRVCLPDRDVEIVSDPRHFEANLLDAFPGIDTRQRRFWRAQAWVGTKLLRTAARHPRLPLRSLSDLAHNLAILGPSGIAAACTSAFTMADALRLFGLNKQREFANLIAMLLQDTAQAGPDVVPFANAAACIQAYRMGMQRPQGGMRALAQGIGQRFEQLGGCLRVATLVERVERLHGRTAGFRVRTRRGPSIQARQVAFNLPIDRALALLGRTPTPSLARAERKSRAVWSAFTGYLAFRSDAIPSSAPLFNQVLQDHHSPMHDGNNVLISLSPPEDPGYAPPDIRIATLSTHVRPDDWRGLDRTQHAARKTVYATRLLRALDRAFPGASEALVHAEFGTPASFARYTRRTAGAVGGAPVRRGNSNLFSVGSDTLGPGLWLVGDSVFPGQGTLAVVLSAFQVLSRMGTPASIHARKRDCPAPRIHVAPTHDARQEVSEPPSTR